MKEKRKLPHATIDTWCCACDYDIHFLNEIITDEKIKLLESLLENCSGGGNWRRVVINKLSDLTK